MSAGLQMLGTTLGVLGWLGTILACALPLWRVTAFIGNNIVTAQVVWEGLWMTCVVQSTGQMQCKVYDSMLALSSDLQASRAILVIAPLVSLLAILASIAGNKCTNCLEQSSVKTRVATVAGVLFLVAGVLSLVPPSWMANAVIRDFYNPLVAQSQKRELGASIFICWGAAALTMIGGGLMCSSCPSGGRQAIHYKPASQTSRAHAAYV
ncbi:claudin-like protein ZF-A9 [Tachysurus fulvidraco]|uniref:claudin-like protein ZF-A9 n=1 Tax=Tachysurus fulvidraco TaxID=1234273 RepID=UPI001FEDB3CC|nr:claudin-like protein ZF-A9 [Tachysurus fulvidraco]